MPKITNMNGLVLPEISSCLNRVLFPYYCQAPAHQGFLSNIAFFTDDDMVYTKIIDSALFISSGKVWFPANLAKSNETDAMM